MTYKSIFCFSEPMSSGLLANFTKTLDATNETSKSPPRFFIFIQVPSQFVLCMYVCILYTVIVILGFPAGYQREDNIFCVRDTIGTYRNLTEAALTCNGIPNCAAIYDYLCGKEMMYSLCLSSSTLRVSHIGSCVYVRGSNLASNLSTYIGTLV